MSDDTALLDHAQLGALIPHAGAMCLLERVTRWDAAHIVCIATSHRAATNPLRAADRLGALCAIEYAAQAMAVHGGLLARLDGPAPTLGYLASVRSVECAVGRLDDIADDLEIEATRLAGESAHVLYGFEVRAGARVLVTGRAAVVLDARANRVH